MTNQLVVCEPHCHLHRILVEGTRPRHGRLTFRQGDVYQKIIEDVCLAAKVDFEEFGVSGQTLTELQQVGDPSPCLLPSYSSFCLFLPIFPNFHFLQESLFAKREPVRIFTTWLPVQLKTAGCDSARKAGLQIRKIAGFPLSFGRLFYTLTLRLRPTFPTALDSFQQVTQHIM